MKRLFTLVFFVTRLLTAFAQTDNSAMLTDMYQRASRFYEEGKFADAVTLLEGAERLSATPDAKMLYLKIKSLNSLYAKDTMYGSALEKAISAFLNVAQLQNYPSAKIQEITDLQLRLQSMIEAQAIQVTAGNKVLQEVANQIEQQMVSIEGSRFGMMGQTPPDAEPIYKVTVSNFYLSKYETTQSQWQAVMGTNPSKNNSCSACPVENVSWNDVKLFVEKLNKVSGKQYRLPTEVEWEYAVRNKGGLINYGTNRNIDQTAWYKLNSGGNTHPVGKKNPNDLGLYDMVGNVAEWCQDSYDPSFFGTKRDKDPVNLSDTGKHSIKGYITYNFENTATGLIGSMVGRSMVVHRSSAASTETNEQLGFRLCRN